MTEEKELKKQVIEKLKGFVQDKSWVRYVKKYQCICDCIMQASENDVEIIRKLDGEVQVITSLQFRADRYYRQIFRDGTLGREYKQNPVRITTTEIAFFGKIYNITKEKLTPLEDYLYDVVLNKQNGSADKCYVDGTYIVYNGKMDNYYLEAGLKNSYEEAYCRANETSLYNYPEKQTRLDLSEWTIVDEGEFAMVVYPILLKIKDKEGKEVKMYVGKYDLLTDSIVDMYEMNIFNPRLFTPSGERRELRKTLFKYVL